MFVWSVETFFTELNTHMPELNKQLKNRTANIYKQDFSRLWNNIEAQSIDYGLLEKLIIFVIRLNLIGTILGHGTLFLMFHLRRKKTMLLEVMD